MDDLLLITEIQNNDKAAFEKLFQRYYSPLVGYITTFTNDSHLSEDIIQQTFIIIWTKRKKLKITKSTKSYLYSVAYNTYVDHYRKKKSRDAFFDELREKTLRNSITEDKEFMEKRLAKLKNIVDALPPKCKEILELNKLNGLKYKEIALKLDISQKTVEAQMRIAFQKIRQGFEEDKQFLFILF
ncbi:RNA polymerase sigma-70 factor [Tamlana sp. 2201CG12-4]|uniref:RNA polymerase sigma factor n=1 Tax=Tamlana sp. 2201CG12-4 TaxID=3112582 RepID=UPI002DB8C946|nr:RNA polymerase sigma-70 factor [Tamlana sp. 2201CG12-4]MEC3906753.1 RNA polymerase sigma-70 factor [Tamlana sp. 2201CG12-4]